MIAVNERNYERLRKLGHTQILSTMWGLVYWMRGAAENNNSCCSGAEKIKMKKIALREEGAQGLLGHARHSLQAPGDDHRDHRVYAAVHVIVVGSNSCCK